MLKIKSRIRRLQGQLSSLETAISEGVPCKDVIPQLLAAKGALDATLKEYLEQSVDSCISSSDEKTLKQVLKMFIKHVA